MTNKVVIVSFKYPPIYSGYGQQLKSITDRIIQNTPDLDLTLLTAYSESKREENSQLKVETFLGKDNQSSKSIYPFAFKIFKWLLNNRENYDVIHCVKAGPEAIACNIVSKLLKKPLLIKVAQDELSLREINDSKGLQKLIRTLRQNSLKNADNFVAISDEIEENIKRIKNKNTIIHKIPNGVDIHKFKPVSDEEKLDLRKSLNIKNEEWVLLYVGAICKRKGIVDLLQAVNQFNPETPFRLILCGPIIEEINFEENIKKLKRKNLTVDYRGKVNNVSEYMQASDVFILPSYSEGLPNVMLEAAASGMLLIGTDIGGTRDIVLNKENGFLINIKSPEAILSTLQSIDSNRNYIETMGRKAHDIANKNFSIDRVSNLYINLYRNLSSKK